MNPNRCLDCGRFHDGECANEIHVPDRFKALVGEINPRRKGLRVPKTTDVKTYGGFNCKRS